MNNFLLSPLARLDLLELWNDMAEGDIDRADRMRENIYAAINKLVAMPGMGHVREDLTQRPLRFWPVSQYLIIYRPDTSPLEIVRVVNGYRIVAGLLIE